MMQGEIYEQCQASVMMKKLQAEQGRGLSMASLIIPTFQDLVRTSKMLTDEYGVAANIKSRLSP
jgi:peptide chain release factor subunit 1